MLCLLETRVAGQCVFAADACMRKVKDAGFCLDPDPISGKAKKGNEQEPPDQGYRQRGGEGGKTIRSLTKGIIYYPRQCHKPSS